MEVERKRVYIFRGISGSGKSTIARKIVNEELERMDVKSIENLDDIDSIHVVAYCSA